MYSNVAESLKSRGILPKQRSTQPRTRDQANHFYSVTTTHLFATSKTPFEAENEKHIWGCSVMVKVRLTLLVVVVMLSGLPEMVNQNQLFWFYFLPGSHWLRPSSKIFISLGWLKPGNPVDVVYSNPKLRLGTISNFSWKPGGPRSTQSVKT